MDYKKTRAAVARAKDGVEYSAKRGARCPACGKRTKITTTRPWEGESRIRYSRCVNPRCILCSLDLSIKSVQAAA